MGYELDRLMSQIGVKTPTLAYSGISKPVAPTALGANPTPEQTTAYNDLLAKYKTDQGTYKADQAAYKPLEAAYNQSLSDFNLYNQPQFNTGLQSSALPTQPSTSQPSTPQPGGRFTRGASLRDWLNSRVKTPSASAVALPPKPAVASPTQMAISDSPSMSYDSGTHKSSSSGPSPFAGFGSALASGLSAYGGNQAAQLVTPFTAYGARMLGDFMAAPAGNVSLASALGNMGLNGLSNAIARNTNPNYSNEGRGADANAMTADQLSAMNDQDQQYSMGTPSESMSSSSESNSSTEGSGMGDGSSGVYARGGRVKKHFAEGGLNDMAETYAVTPRSEMQSVQLEPMSQPAEPMPVPVEPAPQPVQRAAPAAMLAQSGGQPVPAGLLEMLNRYQGEGAYGAELKNARETSSRETEAFNRMLQDAINQKTESGPSKSEMYFRLAAAFGAPTRTGGFSESLANVGAALGEHAKETRAADKANRLNKLTLGLEAQKAKMAGAKDDLTTLRTLASEEMKDKRAIANELIKEYVKSGQAQSSAGKQAQDEGLTPGTPAFQSRVGKIAEMNIEKQMVGINAALAGMQAQQATAGLAQRKFEFQQGQATKLSPAELKLKTEAEDSLGALDQATSALKQAYSLNPNTFDTSVPDTVQRKLLEASGSKDQRLLNTRLQENLLGEKALAGLKAAVGGNPTEGERKVLMDLQGIGAKSIEERRQILLNAFKQTEATRARTKKRLEQVGSGAYREATPGGID